MSLIWLAPAAAGVIGALALVIACRNTVRAAERLRVSLSRLGELRSPARLLGDDVRGLGAAIDELRRR
ncbi:MAG: hypothetical protein JO265_15445 [Acidimicrobiia bacterium]|nr:hypothetical protein [Acidimicrobiia bacterium]